MNDAEIINQVYVLGLVEKISSLHITEQQSFSEWWNLDRTLEEWLTYWENRVPILASVPYYQTCGRILDTALFPQWLEQLPKEVLLAIFKGEL